jgi:hypothetical protein
MRECSAVPARQLGVGKRFAACALAGDICVNRWYLDSIAASAMTLLELISPALQHMRDAAYATLRRVRAKHV